ncbi:MAG: hypothetical protein HY257_04130 [Chloroflexi bacterium]|nr:hypothetical protein [Chloroflexota bacterium]
MNDAFNNTYIAARQTKTTASDSALCTGLRNAITPSAASIASVAKM